LTNIPDSWRILLDTNILLRDSEEGSPMQVTAQAAIDGLVEQGAVLCIVPQVMYEFYTVSTRPSEARGGFGWNPEQAAQVIERYEQAFTTLPDLDDIYGQWKRLVTAYDVAGVAAHDARLMAAMIVHAVPALLTFNDSHFRRYEEGEGITVLSPATVGQ
jgi:predicted nucleic acid-binding protein